MENYYDSLTRQYPVTKTIRQELKPVGKTLENIKNAEIIEADKQKKEAYVKVKELMDEFHKSIIEKSLVGIKLDGLSEFEKLYKIKTKTDEDKNRISELFYYMRKQIADALKNSRDYGYVDNKDLIEKILPERVKDENSLNALSCFKGFTTYFTDYYKNRKNIYSDEEKHSTVGYRCINENLLIFMSNIEVYQIYKKANIKNDNYDEETLDKTFMIESFNECLTQSGVEAYNSVVASIKTATNLYIQKNNKEENFVRVPKMKVLFKQILSDRTSLFDGLIIESDDELLDKLCSFSAEVDKFLPINIDRYIKTLMDSNNGTGIYVKNDLSLTTLSNYLTGSWSSIRNAFNENYDAKYTGKVNDKYEEKREKAYKSNDSFELNYIQKLLGINVIDKYIERINFDIKEICEAYKEMTKNCFEDHDKTKKLQKNIKAVASIKSYLDSLKNIERDIKLLNGTGLESRNEFFYGEQSTVLEEITKVDELYNITRNYLTKKPFSTEKMKLNFNNPQLLGGWDVNKERDCYGVILIKDNNYYLGIMDKSANKSFLNIKESKNENAYKKVNCKLLPGPNKMFPKVFFAKSNIDYYDPTHEIKELYDKGTFKKGNSFNLEDCHKLIDFYKESIKKNDDWKNFNFNFTDTKDYEDISGFFREVEAQNYKITYTNVSCDFIESLVDEGKLYLFQIYNKDFSEYATGNLNLHTLYLKMLFDERNLKDLCIKMNGEAEVFYRPASILDEDKVVHKANQKITNKNTNSKKKESIFSYDIVKDKRYTVDKFFIHLPITLNYKEQNVSRFNDYIREKLKKSKNIRVIGIDRGERNLLYVVVCDSDGSILYQRSINEIVSGSHKTDYHKLLDNKEKERLSSRRDWKTIENIKDLKAGYMSQVVNEIYNLILKYNAIVVLEDLNIGFKNGRKKVEKQVYQNFEKALIDKLNYLCIDKTREQLSPSSPGGVLNAYQLTAKFESFEKIGKQTGCIFYVPAYLTSQIDPTTGFVNLFYQKDTSKQGLQSFFRKFKKINFDKVASNFEFVFDYNDFTNKAEGTKTNWTISTQGTRIAKYRSDDANGKWISRTVHPTDIIKEALNREKINYNDGHDLIDEIVSIEKSAVLKEIYYGFKLTLQLRNSTLANEEKQEDYIISPVKNSSGNYFDSRITSKELPCDADANGAYNIARKGLWALEQIRNAENVSKVKLAISNKEWFEYTQNNIPSL